MTRRKKKILLVILLIVVGFPLALIGSAAMWFYFSDVSSGSIVSSGQTRHYLLHVPNTYDPSKPAPLLISLHGAALWPAVQMEVSRWNEVADEHGFIVVYPAGVGFTYGPKAWHMGPRSVEADVGFISALIDKLQREYNIDPDRIYADGLSNGGNMAFALSCRMGDRLAAVGTVAAPQTLPFDWCGDAPPVPTINFHGTDDRMVPYAGGQLSDPVNPKFVPAVRDWTSSWARRNRCAEAAVETRVSASVNRLSYPQCERGADVVLYTVEGGGHTWPGGKPLPEWLAGPTSNEISASRLMREFFRAHPRAPARSSPEMEQVKAD